MFINVWIAECANFIVTPLWESQGKPPLDRCPKCGLPVITDEEDAK